jgi:hypothetical protein
VIYYWAQAVRLLAGEAKEHPHVSHSGQGRRDLTPSCLRRQSAPRQEAATTPKAELFSAPAPGYRSPATIHRAPWTVRLRRPAKAASACLPPAASQTRRGGRPPLGPGVTAPWKGTPGCAGAADC